jgi:signal transduction histidine kinase
MILLRSLSFRLALTYVALFTASVLILLASYYWISIERPHDAVRRQVAREAAILGDNYILNGAPALTRALAARTSGVSQRKPFHVFIAPGGTTVTANLPSWPRRTRDGWLQVEADVHDEGVEQDHDALLLVRTFDDGARLMVGRDIVEIVQREETLWSGAAYIIGIVVLLGSLGGFLMSRAIGQRIDAVAQTARQVMTGDLSGRVAVQGSGDDFDRLGATLNAMLARIETLFEAVRRVSDDIAHELRTPLARLHADLADLAAATEDERPDLVRQAIEETERLQSVFDALLRIARIESGRHGFVAIEVDLTQLLTDAAEYYAPEADDRGIALDSAIEAGLRVSGDRDLLFQAVLNLLDNAIKFSPSGSVVMVGAASTSGHVEISLADAGPGIAAEHRERVSERFYRIPETRAAAGAGLGLSLVAAILRLHGATMMLGDNGPGLRVSWRMALSSHGGARDEGRWG